MLTFLIAGVILFVLLDPESVGETVASIVNSFENKRNSKDDG